MATLVSDPIRYLADEWENNCGYPSAVLSGILPDARHLNRGGYHCSVEDLRRFGNQGDYSNTRPDDKDFNERYGAAVDVSMSPADMRRCHDRVRKVWADLSDPRRRYINAINTWPGTGDAVRLDFYAGTATYASPDHKWHNHGEMRRRWLLDMTAARAIVSVLKGESKQQYLAADGDSSSTGDDMSFVDVKHGDRSPEVSFLQRRLEDLGTRVNGEPIKVDGHYWDMTAAHVRAAELMWNPKFTGNGKATTAETWTRLNRMFTDQRIDAKLKQLQPPAAPTVDYRKLAGSVDLAQLAARVDHPALSAMLVRDPDLLQRLVGELVRALTAHMQQA